MILWSNLVIDVLLSFALAPEPRQTMTFGAMSAGQRPMVLNVRQSPGSWTW